MLAVLFTLLTITNPNATVCATINNVDNTASWNSRSGKIIRTSYHEGDTGLIYDRPVPKQVRMAEGAIVVTPAASKTVTVCS